MNYKQIFLHNYDGDIWWGDERVDPLDVEYVNVDEMRGLETAVNQVVIDFLPLVEKLASNEQFYSANEITRIGRFLLAALGENDGMISYPLITKQREVGNET